MSYAAVAAHDAPPPSLQPQADPALLNTQPPTASNVADDTKKVNLVSPDFKQHPATVTSETIIIEPDHSSPSVPHHSKKDKAKKRLHHAEQEGFQLWHVAKEQLLRPGVAGGLVGVVNVGLIAGAGYMYYSNPHLRRDTKTISSTVAATLVLLGFEGYAAEAYRETPRGQQEEKRAREEGALVYRQAREHILRPGVLGGLVGFVNTSILGTVGYLAYTNWDKPHWDRRTVSAVSIGLLTLWGGEGFLAAQYRESKH
ncbi:hypothetical protein JAAARDRAFT_58152 [Jaapia argillacea MUCL 33604]|uniref:Mitochondrial outer membrane protein OM14 C-terminal domain-containing protein n=1 Tax=Jaapia argillacea MUCL 33604 TaxID=933084 RepID=A0A067Q238_9AGAM|nr:hypothetical protein JAAARDRAFT_58152 [Jaapia argillacea MUCL 33604]